MIKSVENMKQEAELCRENSMSATVYI